MEGSAGAHLARCACYLEINCTNYYESEWQGCGLDGKGCALQSPGTYSERLEDGGHLSVTATGWSIKYAWPGPDRRYNWTHMTLHGSRIDKIIESLPTNWALYEDLVKQIGKSGSFERNGLYQMTIRVGGPCEGVCFEHHRLCMSTKRQINEYIRLLEYARARAQEIQATHFGVPVVSLQQTTPSIARPSSYQTGATPAQATPKGAAFTELHQLTSTSPMVPPLPVRDNQETSTNGLVAWFKRTFMKR